MQPTLKELLAQNAALLAAVKAEAAALKAAYGIVGK